MKKLLILSIILLLACPAWGAIVYVKNVSGTVYYESGASSCDDVTAADTSGTLTSAAVAAGNSGTLYICAGTYTNTHLAANGMFRIDNSSLTVSGVGTVNIVPGGTPPATVYFSGTSDGSTISGVTVEVKALDTANYGIYTAAGADNITISKNTVFSTIVGGGNNEIYGIALEGATDTASGNLVYGTNKGIALASASNHTVSGNTVRDLTAGADDSGSDGITLLADGDYTGTVISGNVVHGYRDDGIDIYWGSNVTVSGNEVYSGTDYSTGGADGHGIKCGSSGKTGNKIIKNYVHDINYNSGIQSNASTDPLIAYNKVINVNSGATHAGIGILTGTAGVRVYNNTVIMGTSGCHALSFGAATDTLIVQNNILSKGAAGTPYDFEANSRTITGGYNILKNDASVHGGGNYTDTGTSDKYATDPLLTGTYNLQGNSPAKDTGNPWATYAEMQAMGLRVYGSAPDLGGSELVQMLDGPKPPIGGKGNLILASAKAALSTSSAAYVQPTGDTWQGVAMTWQGANVTW